MIRTLALAAFLLLCGGLAPAFAGEARVAIENFTFKPAALEVKVGTKVTFKNEDDIPHLVVAVDGSYRSKALDTDDEASITLTKPGVFAYYCGLHPHMQGKITVTP